MNDTKGLFNMESQLQWIMLGVLSISLAVSAVLYYFKVRGNESAFLCGERKAVTVRDIIQISHDTKRILLALDSSQQRLGLPIGQHILLYGPNKGGIERGKWNNKDDLEEGEDEVFRKYTPVSSSSSRGVIEILVKVYKPRADLGFADGGKISTYVDSLKIGDKLDISGPYGNITYLGYGKFNIGKQIRTAKSLGLIAGGTGLTPIYQLIREILENPSDKTKLYLLYANKTQEDILLRDELEEYAAQYPDRLKIWYTVDQPPSRWQMSVGFITADMIQEHLPPPSSDTLVFCCGPPPMVQHACKKNLKALGYDDSAIATF